MFDKKFLTVNELAVYTGWKKSYIYKLTHIGTLKYSKPLGKTIFFSKEWIDNFLSKNEKLTSEELSNQAVTYVTTNKLSK